VSQTFSFQSRSQTAETFDRETESRTIPKARFSPRLTAAGSEPHTGLAVLMCWSTMQEVALLQQQINVYRELSTSLACEDA
jgi:hypothetical protein